MTRLTVLLIAVATSSVYTQAPPPSAASGPAFDVVSIKKNTTGALGSNGSGERPDGSFTLLNAPVGILISRAYPPAVPVDMVGLPGWAMSERYDTRATSSLSQPATPDERIAMLRAMLADRFKLVAHMESRDQQGYDLVVARKDGRLGPNIKPSDVDCEARIAADRAAGTPPARLDFRDPNWTAPPCTRWTIGDRMQGDYTMEMLTMQLRLVTRSPNVVDKTGLAGSYRVTLTFNVGASLRGPETAPSADASPSIFTALQEQLGLKLESSKASRETLVIDHLERPTEN